MADLKCPNCGAVCVAGADGKCACAACGGSFTFVAGEAKLAGVGELDQMREKLSKHDADLEEIKKTLPASRPGGQPPEDPGDKEGPEEIEPDGYLDEDEDEEDF